MASETRILRHDNAQEIAEWCGGRVVAEIDPFNADQTSPGINVPVGNGVDRASIGDLIIGTDDGKFEVFKA